VNFATAERSVLTVSVQSPLPEQSPDPTSNEERADGFAVTVRVTDAHGAEHVGPQCMAAGLELTVPVPLPDFATVSVLPRYRASAKS
jgi:hypothetical protein